MNTALKAILQLIFDSLVIEQDAVVAKKSFLALLPDLFPLLADLVAAVPTFTDLPAEIKALGGSAQEADLIAFIETKFGSALPSGKAAAILAASLKTILDIVQDGLALEVAIKS